MRKFFWDERCGQLSFQGKHPAKTIYQCEEEVLPSSRLGLFTHVNFKIPRPLFKFCLVNLNHPIHFKQDQLYLIDSFKFEMLWTSAYPINKTPHRRLSWNSLRISKTLKVCLVSEVFPPQVKTSLCWRISKVQAKVKCDFFEETLVIDVASLSVTGC